VTVATAPLPGLCSACGSSSLIELPIQLADGTDVTFQSCQRCESREWLEPDGAAWSTIPIADVLERSARRPR
jgi:hypothetical protein